MEFNWTQGALPKVYAVTMRVTSSVRTKRGRPCGWKRTNPIRRPCKG